MRLDKDKWQKAFEKELDKAEKRQSSKVRRYYKNQYYKGTESFLSSGQTSFQLLFSTSELLKIYRDLYSDIGLQFAKWYARNFDKYIKKGVNPNQYVDEWQNSFASYGSAVGAERVTLVSGTAKATLVKVTQNLMTDLDFQNLGIAEKTRILRSQFNKYSAFQAERLVRTEATSAANFATLKSANTIFPAADMMKEWIASFDDRTRSTHAEAGASEPVPQNEPFMVGGALMMYPGDPSGPASEVINCRCSIAPFPKETAQATGEITDINFGLGGGTRTGYGLGDFVADVGATAASGVTETNYKNKIDEILATNPNVPKNIVNLIDDFDGFDLSIFNHFKKIQKLNIKKVRANHTGGIISMDKRTIPHITNTVYIHESGHFVADSRGWIIRGIFRGEKDRAAKPLEQIFSKWKKDILNKSNIKKYFDEINSLSYESFETIGKKLGYTNSRIFLDDMGSLKDTFGALTKERIGGGHGVSYYKKVNKQWHEFIAHAYENRFQGNKLFKSMYPEMYDDMIKMVDELNLNY